MSGVPGPITRFVALFFAPAYLWLLAVLLARTTGNPLYATLIAVVLGGIALVVILSMLSARFFDPNLPNQRWSIGTFMLFTAAMAIYFGYIGQFVSQLQGQPVSWYGIAIVFFYASFFIGTTTAVLLFFADSLIVIVESILDLVRRITG